MKNTTKVTLEEAQKSIAQLKGDLTKLDRESLSLFRGEIARKDKDKRYQRQEGQRALRNAVAWWAGVEHARGHSESKSYRRFYSQFGIDVASAQLLDAWKAVELALRVQVELAKVGVDGAVEASPKSAHKKRGKAQVDRVVAAAEAAHREWVERYAKKLRATK